MLGGVADLRDKRVPLSRVPLLASFVDILPGIVVFEAQQTMDGRENSNSIDAGVGVLGFPSLVNAQIVRVAVAALVHRFERGHDAKCVTCNFGHVAVLIENVCNGGKMAAHDFDLSFPVPGNKKQRLFDHVAVLVYDIPDFVLEFLGIATCQTS